MALSIATKFTEIIRCEKDDYHRTDIKNVFILRNIKNDMINIVQSKQKVLIDIMINKYPNKNIQFSHDDVYDLSFIITDKGEKPVSYHIYTGKLNGYRFSTDNDFNFVAVEIELSKANNTHYNSIIRLNKIFLDIIKAHYDIDNDDEYQLIVSLEKHEEEGKE